MSTEKLLKTASFIRYEAIIDGQKAANIDYLSDQINRIAPRIEEYEIKINNNQDPRGFASRGLARCQNELAKFVGMLEDIVNGILSNRPGLAAQVANI